MEENGVQAHSDVTDCVTRNKVVNLSDLLFLNL